MDRCLMSAQSVLASMYAPEGNQMWGEGLPWQPIPVHTVPKDTDPVSIQHWFDVRPTSQTLVLHRTGITELCLVFVKRSCV